MDEVVLVVDADRNYYAFDAERFAATEAGEDGSEVHPFSADEIDAAKVSDQDREAIEAAIQPDEVSGFGAPIPGVDVKLGKKPGAGLSINVLGNVRGSGGVSVMKQPGSLGIAINENGIK